MTERAIVCPGCSEVVPYGRLSCPACGTLLASVAGGVRPTLAAADAPAPVAPPAAGEDAAGVGPDPVVEAPPAEPARLRAARKSASAAVAGAYVPPGATPPAPPPAPAASSRVGAGALPPPRTALGKGRTQATKAPAAASAAPPLAPSPSLLAATAGASAAAIADAAPPEAPPVEAPPPEAAPPPDAEPTPSEVSSTTEPRPLPPQFSAAPAVIPLAAPTAAMAPAGAAPVAPTTSTPAGAPAPATSPDELAWLDPGLDWATVAGAGLIAIGMLLPWSRTVLGASGVGYFDTWGLAGPAHLLVFLWAVAVVALSVVRKPAPPWVRTGLAGFALGVFSLGLTWPYLFGPLGAGIGVLAVAVGSFVLIATGVLAAWRARHVRAEPPV